MNSIVIGSLLISLLHSIIPNHWLPVIAIGRKENWSVSQITRVTLFSGLAHALSTVGIGFILAFAGFQLHKNQEGYFHWIGPVILIILGIFFIIQHYRHRHFHLHKQVSINKSKSKIIFTLLLAMFLSPCMEIEAYFLMAGAYGWELVLLLSISYTVITVSGMVIWVRIAYKRLLKLNWHALEHNAGIITGLTLIITGIITFFLQ